MQNFIRHPFLKASASTALALFIAARYFQEVLPMAASALIALSLVGLMHEFLEDNRIAIWEQKNDSHQVNELLARRIATIFFGIFATAGVLQILYPAGVIAQSTPLALAFRNSLVPLLLHNLAVLSVFIFLAALYRAGGLVVVLAWNALHWSQTLVGYLEIIIERDGVIRGLIVGVTLLPHLIFESVSYIIAGMSGVFLSKAFAKYSLSSPQFQQVSKATLGLMLASLVLILIAALFEIYLAQPIFHG